MISAILALGFLGVSVFAATVHHPSSSVSPATTNTAPNFNSKEHVGLSYEHPGFFDPAQRDTKCVTTSEYTLHENGTISVWNLGFDASTKAPKSINAVARILDTAADGSKFKIKFSAFTNVLESKYWIAGTDFDNHTVVFVCKQLASNSDRVRPSTMTSNKHPSKKVNDKVNDGTASPPTNPMVVASLLNASG